MRAPLALLLAGLLAAPLAGAHHEPLNCSVLALGLFTPLSQPVGCSLPLSCPAAGVRCEFDIAFEVRVAAGAGVVQGHALVGGGEVAACGPAAGACAGTAALTLRPGESVPLACETMPQTLVAGEVQVTCAPSAWH